MKRTTIMVEEAILAELERLARRSGRPTAHLIRESLERYVHQEEANEPRQLPTFVGIGHGPGDVAAHDEEILQRELPANVREELAD